MVLVLESDEGGTKGWEGTKEVRAEQRSAEMRELAMSITSRGDIIPLLCVLQAFPVYFYFTSVTFSFVSLFLFDPNQINI